MLIDRRHTRWIGATLLVGTVALALYLYLRSVTPGGLTGGSLVGMWYGIIGSGLMVYAGLLSALRKIPSWWWLGSRKVWLKGHIWLGLLSALFLLCHSSFRWGGPLEIALWAAVIGTLATGVAGLALQQVLPRLLTARFPNEVPYEQIPHLCNVVRHKADEAMARALASTTQGRAWGGTVPPTHPLHGGPGENRPVLRRGSPAVPPTTLPAQRSPGQPAAGPQQF